MSGSDYNEKDNMKVRECSPGAQRSKLGRKNPITGLKLGLPPNSFSRKFSGLPHPA